MHINLKNNYILYIIFVFLVIGSTIYLIIKNDSLTENFNFNFFSNNNLKLNTLGTDKIYVINLEDRRNSMIELTNFLHLNITFFTAINTETVKKDFTYVNKPNHMEDGQLACWLSHMKIYEEITNNNTNIEKALILEDDVDIHIDIIEITKLALNSLNHIEWDMLFLGHCSKTEGNPKDLINEDINLYKANYPSCTHGYIITKNGALKMLKYRSNPNLIDWQIGDLGVENYLNIYIISPPIILQYHTENDFSNVVTDGTIHDPVINIFNLTKFSGRKFMNLTSN